MKRTSLLVIIAAAFPALLWGKAWAQDEALSGDSGATNNGEATVAGAVADGAPSSSVPSPRLLIEPEDILDSKTEDLGDRMMTTQRIAPLTLPPIPAPAPPPDPLSPEAQQRLQELGAKYRETTIVFIGATVYHSATFSDGPRTLVRIWDQKSRTGFECWSSANWAR